MRTHPYELQYQAGNRWHTAAVSRTPQELNPAYSRLLMAGAAVRVVRNG